MASSDRRYSTSKTTNSTIQRTMPAYKTSAPNSTVITIDNSKSKAGETTANNTDLVVFGIPLYSYSKPVQFSICCGGVLIFYLIYGYVQEWLFRIEGFKPFGWYLTLVQFGLYAIFGTVETSFQEDRSRKIPLKTYAGLAFLTVSTMGLSNSSLGYLNYPTQVIFKSCKLIPVMIGGIIIQGKRYGPTDFLACLCMSAGLIMFTLADSKLQPEFNHTGIILISLALCADAVIGNVQEKTMRSYRSTNTEVVLYSYGIGFLYILCGLLVSGGLLDAFKFCAKHDPVQIYGLAFLFSLSGYLGITFVLMLVRIFGALLAVTVTTFRKAVTMVLSFLFFTKPFTILYVWSGCIVFLGIFLNVYSKNRAQMNASFLRYLKMATLFFTRDGKGKPILMENV